jgi:hypothetical protein
MNVVNVDCVKSDRSNRRLKIGKRIDASFNLPPVEFIFPVLGQPLDITKRGSVRPQVATFQLVWEGRMSELSLKLLQSLIRNGEFERRHFDLFQSSGEDVKLMILKIAVVLSGLPVTSYA